jgi:hypothetical protein
MITRTITYLAYPGKAMGCSTNTFVPTGGDVSGRVCPAACVAGLFHKGSVIQSVKEVFVEQPLASPRFAKK